MPTCAEDQMPDSYDLLVIGAGMAGVNAANKAGAAGWRVAIVDELPYGGTCALRGCDPKKILRRGAEIVDAARLLQGKGIDPGGLAIDWDELMAHKRGFTDRVPGNMERGLESNGVETLHGTATFTGPDELEIDGRGLRADRFLVATGARPRPLDFPGAQHLVDSTDFLHLDSLPGRILFVGGGFVSMEFAHIAARAGASVTVVDRGPRPLDQFDPDLVDQLVERSTEVGIDIATATAVTRVERSRDGYEATLEHDGTRSTLRVDLVVHGAGRVPELSRLGLDAADVTTGPRGVEVAPHLQSTTNPRVWAAGDAADTPGMPLTPVAVFEGKVAASNMIEDKTTVPDYDGVPTVVYTIPELARVGMLESDARQASIDLEVRHEDTSSWFSNYRLGERTAATKILVDRDSDTIVGAHMLGPDYGELINFCALAIKLGLTTRQLRAMTASYPSVSSDLGSML